jgi:hypothetical protein
MKRSVAMFSFFVLLVVGLLNGPLPLSGQGRGRGPSPEAIAAREKQLALEKSTSQLQITEEVLPLSIPGHTIGETEGVSKTPRVTCSSTRAPAWEEARAEALPPSCSSSTST